MSEIKHPAKYSEAFIPIFCEILQGTKNVLDPFGGVGKIGKIKEYGYSGKVYANEIEREWLEDNKYNCDFITFEDAETLNYPNGYFEAICTSPTYGNRMADHHNAKDASKRNTYTHCLGRKLSPANTGAMQWGESYRQKHIRIYKHLFDLLQDGGIFVLNISDHIRKGEVMRVSEWHYNTLLDLGFECLDTYIIQTPRLKFGANNTKRVTHETIFVFKKL